jgi:hypothetical protein
MQLRHWFLMIVSVLAASAMPPGTPFAQPPVETDFTEASPEPPLPPGIKERVFIHLPRTDHPNHLGTCTVTINDRVNDYGLGGWQLPNSGIIWRLNPETLPPNLTAAVVQPAMRAAFATWAAADSSKQFQYGGPTSVTRSRLDYVNAVLWGRVSAGAIAITYVRYYTSTGIIADVDTVFNQRYPWAVFNLAQGECQTTPDAYDVQDIATHEFGHWVGLEDLYASQDRDLTMYGYGAGGELKKRTLGTGDVTGARTVAP